MISQDNPTWTYFFGSSISETYKKLESYLSFFEYKGLFSQTDSTLKLTVTDSTGTWTIYSTFFYDEQGRCYAYSNRRCDSIGKMRLQLLLNDKRYKWRRIGPERYLSKYSRGELLETSIEGKCTTSKQTKLYLTRKQFRGLRRSSG